MTEDQKRLLRDLEDELRSDADDWDDEIADEDDADMRKIFAGCANDATAKANAIRDALTTLSAYREALELQEQAEQLDAELAELYERAEAEGWDELTGGSHLTSAGSRVGEAYGKAREARRQALSNAPKSKEA